MNVTWKVSMDLVHIVWCRFFWEHVQYLCVRIGNENGWHMKLYRVQSRRWCDISICHFRWQQWSAASENRLEYCETIYPPGSLWHHSVHAVQCVHFTKCNKNHIACNNYAHCRDTLTHRQWNTHEMHTKGTHEMLMCKGILCILHPLLF